MYFFLITLKLLGILFLLSFAFLLLLFLGKTKITLYLQATGNNKYISIALDIVKILRIFSFRYLFAENKYVIYFFNIPFKFSKKSSDYQKKSVTQKKKQDKKKKDTYQDFKQLLAQRNYIKNIIKKVYYKIIDFEVEGNVKIGLGSPYLTGLMLGFYNSIWYIIPKLKKIKIEPDFFDYRLAGNAKITLELYLVKLLPLGFDVLRNNLIKKFKRSSHGGRTCRKNAN
ncbi:MAG: DUF2953 domain-containing protein [Candidatus Marinimicrobia bacterium]|nr:DUF2953 domain-containing protein [Candidatus Neomarinimicrobiota bacterium]